MPKESLDRSLRYFIAIAELKSLSKAAEALDQTQSGLSKQLAVLESKLGAPLFTRTGRGVELTEAGARLHASLAPAFRDIDAAVDRARQHSDTHGTVRLATVHTLSYYFATDVVAKFVSTRPHVNLQLLGRSSPEVVDLVDSGRADLGFVYDVAVDVNTVSTHPLFEDRMAFIVRGDSSLASTDSLSDADLRLVGFPAHYALRRMIERARIPASYVAEAETIDAMLKLVASGVGNCILPARIPDKLLVDFGLRKLPMTVPALSRWVVAITPAHKPLSPLVSQFLEVALGVAEGLRRERTE